MEQVPGMLPAKLNPLMSKGSSTMQATANTITIESLYAFLQENFPRWIGTDACQSLLLGLIENGNRAYKRGKNKGRTKWELLSGLSDTDLSKWVSRSLRFAEIDQLRKATCDVEVDDKSTASSMLADCAITSAAYQEEVDYAFHTLSPRDKQVAASYFVEGMSLRETAERVGLTEGRICQLIPTIRQAIRERTQRVA
jgi:RNA polymerase sigma factor (sigma-70 family)